MEDVVTISYLTTFQLIVPPYRNIIYLNENFRIVKSLVKDESFTIRNIRANRFTPL